MSQAEEVPRAVPLTPAEEAEIPAAVPLSSAEEWAYSGAWWTDFETTYKAVAIAYDRHRETLQVEYEGGVFWEYGPIAFDEAVSLYGAPSIGTWFWENVRVRGTVSGHQVGAVRAFG